MGMEIDRGMIVGAAVEDISPPTVEDGDGDEFYMGKNGNM